MSRQEVLDRASLSTAAQSKFDEASTQRKSIERIINMAKSNPVAALMDPELGLTPDQVRDSFEKWYHKQYIEPETLSPAEKKNRELQSQLERYQQEEQERKQKSENDEQEKLTTQQRGYLQNQIIEAMDTSGLPKTEFFVSRMAFYMRQNLVNGWDAPTDMIVRQVKNEFKNMLSSDFVQKADPATIIDFLGGDEFVNKLRRYDLQKLRENRSGKIGGQGGGATEGGSSSQGGTGKVDMAEVNRRLRDMRMGKL